MAKIRRRFKMQSGLIVFFYLIPLMTILLAINVYPFLSGLFNSFRNLSYNDRSGSFAGFNNYINVLTEARIWKILVQTFVYTGLAVFLSIIIGLFLAALLNRDIPLKKLLRTINILPWITPAGMIGIIFSWLLSKNYSPLNDILLRLHLIENPIDWLGNISAGIYPLTLPMIVLILVYVWIAYPFTFIMFLAGMQSIPEDIYESSRVDGANYFQQYFNITLPLLKPVLAVTACLLFIWTFQYFNLVYLLTRGGPRGYTELLSITIYTKAFNFYETGEASALGFVMTLFLLLPSIYYIKTAYSQMKEEI